MRFGRVICVGIPILLTLGAIITYLIATLSGVAHNKLYIFRVDLSNLDLNEDNLGSITDKLQDDIGNILGRSEVEERAVSAATLGLGQSYDVSLWGYCENDKNGKQECKKAQFDWASANIEEDILKPLINDKKVDLPSEIDGALKVFGTVTKYTEIAYIITLVALGVELFLGAFASCTRIMSCLTTLVSIVAIIFSGVASGLSTAMALIVVGAIKAAADKYGVKASFNTNFLACVWIGFAFSLAAGLFWLFSACCCKPDHRDKRRSDGEKLLPSTGYYPISGTSEHEMTGGNTSYHNQYEPTVPSYQPSYNQNNRHGHSSSDVAYEPFSHRA